MSKFWLTHTVNLFSCVYHYQALVFHIFFLLNENPPIPFLNIVTPIAPLHSLPLQCCVRIKLPDGRDGHTECPAVHFVIYGFVKKQRCCVIASKIAQAAVTLFGHSVCVCVCQAYTQGRTCNTRAVSTLSKLYFTSPAVCFSIS